MKNTFKKINSETSSNKTAPEKSKVLNTGPERIAKVIARSGLCSRRDAERWIINGQVKLNSKILTECGVNVTSRDVIEVNGKPLPNKVITKLWMYHKPVSYTHLTLPTNREV